MRKCGGLILMALMLSCAACAWGQGLSNSNVDEWTGSAEQKILGLATIWAEAKYSFPSFAQVPELDWDRSFEEFVPRVIDASDKDEYYWTLMEFAGLLNDGHTSVIPPWGYMRPDFDNPPIEVQVVDGRLVVVRVGDAPELAAEGVIPGLEIVKIDGQEARSYFDESVSRYYPRGSAFGNDAVNVVYLLRGPAGSNVVLSVREEDGAEREVTLTRNSMLPDGSPFFPRLLLWVMADPALETMHLSDGIEYARVAHFEDPGMADEFLNLIDSIDDEKTAGLIIDLRFCMGGRGDVSEKMLGALIDVPVSSPHWRYPIYSAAQRNWGRPIEWGTASNTIEPRDGKRFPGPIVVLTGGVTGSSAEDFAISLREAGRTVLVGERTAGSAGNPVGLALPGGGEFKMATFRAYLPDGAEYVGTGLQPDVAVSPTVDDVRGGVDPVMEKALEVLADWSQYRPNAVD